MDWTKGYTSTWEVQRMDVGAWAPSGKIGNVAGFSISRSCTESVPLLETASMEVDEGFEDGWYMLSMVAEQGAAERVQLGVFLFETESSAYDYGRRTVEAKGYSVLKPADDILMPYGQYAPKGANGAELAGQFLRRCTPAPVVVEEGFTLEGNVVFDVGMSYLAAAWAMLDAGGHCIQLDGDGTVRIIRKPTEPDIELSRLNAAVLVPGVKDATSFSGVPNRYYAVQGAKVATAINDDPASAASFRNRGRWVDAVDTSPKPVNGESLEQYAARKLKEAASVTKKVTYTREYWPGVRPFSIVRGSMPDVGLEGDLMVMTQSLTCENGVVVPETAGRAVTA